MLKILSIAAGLVVLLLISVGFVIPALVNTTLIPAWMIVITITVYSFATGYINYHAVRLMIKWIEK